ncbi:MAG: 30S ribosomal protein S6 [Verrucomicrobiae bacterium]|nr:30S ribosomal protein S6 [Verrucomicrobiae bacterium]MCP5522041.1 30S ribosomal protein S6 [Verrucomicrobiales bacterium]
MKRYEGLFILDTAGKEESVRDIIDRVTGEVSKLGGKIESIQKMDKKPFARVTTKKVTSGFYVNVIFDAEPETVVKLQHHFDLDDDVYRLLVTLAPAVTAQAETADAAA